MSGSVFVTWLSRAGSFVQRAWRDSVAGRAVRACGRALAPVVADSRCLGWLAGRLTVAGWWRGSALSRLGLAAWSALSGGGVRLAAALRPALADSFLFGTVPRWHRESGVHRLLLWLGGLTAGAEAGRAGGIAWAFGLFLACVPFLPTALLLVFAWLLIGATVWSRWAAGEPGWHVSRLHFPFVAWGVVLIGATVSSVNFHGSVTSFVLYMTYVVLAWAAGQAVRTRADLAGLTGYALAGGAAAAAVAVFQRLIGATHSTLPWVDPTMADEIKRVWWPFDNPNILAGYLTFLLPLAVAAVLSSPDWRRRAVQAGIAGLAALALLLTYSRGGWLAAAAAIAWIGIAWDRRILGALVAGGLAGLAAFPETVMRRAASIFSLADSSNYYRLTLWGTAQRMLHDHWQFGVGLGTQAFASIYPDYMLAGARAAHVHNLFLQTWIEVGIGGIVALGWIVLVFAQLTLTGLFRGRRRPELAVWAAFVAAMAGAVGAQLLHGLVEHTWFSPKLAFVFWLALGLGAAAAHVPAAADAGTAPERPAVSGLSAVNATEVTS